MNPTPAQDTAQHSPGSPVTLKDGTRTIYQGPQDIPGFGFFGNPGEFYGRPMSDIQTTPEASGTFSPLPWRVVQTTSRPGGQRKDILTDGLPFSPSFVAGDIMPNDAEYILLACNSRPALLADNERLRQALRAMLEAYAPMAADTEAKFGPDALHSAVKQARAALAASGQ